MILKSKLYTRKEPTRDARLFIIYCEGNRREPDYFRYFQEISSRLKLVIVKADPHANNSPTGLYEKAKSDLTTNSDKSSVDFAINDLDEVWFVIDTDTWGDKIQELRTECNTRKNWFVAQSDPCFELWLFYHYSGSVPDFEGCHTSSNWKDFLNSHSFPGGFDSRKHPMFIQQAIKNAKKIYKEHHKKIEYGVTEVYKLAEAFLPLVRNVIEKALKRIKKVGENNGNKEFYGYK